MSNPSSPSGSRWGGGRWRQRHQNRGNSQNVTSGSSHQSNYRSISPVRTGYSPQQSPSLSPPQLHHYHQPRRSRGGPRGGSTAHLTVEQQQSHGTSGNQTRDRPTVDMNYLSTQPRSPVSRSAVTPVAVYRDLTAAELQMIREQGQRKGKGVYVPDPIAYSAEYMRKLRGVAVPTDVLAGKGYTMGQLTERDLERKKRCAGCGKLMPKPPRPRRERPYRTSEGRPPKDASDSDAVGKEAEPVSLSDDEAPDMGENTDTNDQGHEQPADVPVAMSPEKKAKPKLSCRFHPGKVEHGLYNCCNLPRRAPPCSGAEQHAAATYPENHLESAWRYHFTPSPLPPNGLDVRPAVALDCEMGVTLRGDSELIRVSLIDYFTAETLVDKLVYPDERMAHYNTRFSGVTKKDMDDAIRSSNVFYGRDAAREAVWQYVGESTIVVGHSLNNDLNCLRWIHNWVVDTYLWEVLNDEREEGLKAAEEEEERQREIDKKLQEELDMMVNSPFGVGYESGYGGGVSLDELLSEDQEGAGVQGEKGGEGDDKKEKERKKHIRGLKDLTLLKLGRVIQTGNLGHDSVEDAVATRDLAHYIIENQSGYDD